jgi:hypothetical protein
MTNYDPESLEGIPESGRERLEQNREGLYTSDLSVNEFLLVTQAGFDPVGPVVGSSIFHIGFQVVGLTSSRELDVLSQAMHSARHLAMTRGRGGRSARRRRDRRGAPGDRPLRVGAQHGGVHRDRDGSQAPRWSSSSGPEREAVPERPVRPGVLDAASPPSGRDGDGQLRVPRRATRADEDGGTNGA